MLDLLNLHGYEQAGEPEQLQRGAFLLFSGKIHVRVEKGQMVGLAPETHLAAHALQPVQQDGTHGRLDQRILTSLQIVHVDLVRLGPTLKWSSYVLRLSAFQQIILTDKDIVKRIETLLQWIIFGQQKLIARSSCRALL
jgi:hypothetical protein